MQKEYKSINKSVRKKDAMQLLTGKPVYTDDVTPSDALVVKILRSPHANAIVQEINTKAAKLVPALSISILGKMCRRIVLRLQVRPFLSHRHMTV